MFNKRLVNEKDWLQLIKENNDLKEENEKLWERLYRERNEASNKLLNALRKEYMEETRLIKELDKKNVELEVRNEQLAKAKQEIDSLYKLINLLDKQNG